MYTICATGHRPSRLYGYDLSNIRWKRLQSTFQELLVRKRCDWAITGMALGVDTIFALAAIELRDNHMFPIKLHCAIPCRNQSEPWHDMADIGRYKHILKSADRVTYVSNHNYTNGCLEARNRFMVDLSDEVLAVWTGSAGGTSHCIEYANRKGKQVTNLINEKGEFIC